VLYAGIPLAVCLALFILVLVLYVRNHNGLRFKVVFLAFSRVVSCFIVLCFLFFRPRENVRIRRRCSVHHPRSRDWQCKGTKK
jgi:hypothetical protein